MALVAYTDAAADNFVDGVVAYNRKDYTTAFIKLMEAAEDLEPSLEEFLEVARPDNPGVSDNDLTVYWWKQYGAKGTSLDRSSRRRAQYWLGIMYEEGNGVERDYQQAIRWFMKAAESGDVKAQFKVGVMYDSGEGVAQDHGEAARWFKKAAEGGNVDAQYNLGVMYANGKGVHQNYRLAMYWRTRAAQAGDADAQNSLGVMYANGEGVPQDYVQAHKWFNLAAAAETDREKRDRAVKNR